MKKFRINEIFYSLQGEGFNTGRAAVFVRFSGCNLRCPFCDTDFSAYQELTADEIVETVRTSHLASRPSPLVVLTGGEPTLQVDEALIDSFHQQGYKVAMESNGTRVPPANLDWLTVSPKDAPVVVEHCNELKCIFDESGRVEDNPLPADHYFLQPCDVGDPVRNEQIVARCVEYIKQHPRWRLSLQTHKLIHIP
ncbi:MAG: radical SAM protein [Prevotella sp.]|nr:radical SAM protein [Prevotella sp.]